MGSGDAQSGIPGAHHEPQHSRSLAPQNDPPGLNSAQNNNIFAGMCPHEPGLPGHTHIYIY